ncbi:MAG TPA: serine/threonine-protein kinase [Tepidisphaeraceae bacterium]|nr:serine/threonine-protein kinase [Tepidisphaeraceae bacterium]
MLGDVIVLPPQEQTARLAELSISDADRAKLEKWLQLRGSSESFLEKPPSLVMRTIAVARGSLEGTSDSGSRLELADLASLEAMTPPSVPGYEIKNLLGQGGMGTVWRAVQTSTGREVALKVLEPLPLVSPRARARFERELRLAAQLCHPNIARVYDGGTTGAVCYNAMELIDGAPLDEFVESHGLSQRQILDLMIRICQAVAHAHQNAVIHRDLKPSNILVDKEGQPHLLDFGIARALEEATAETDLLLTLDGVLAGTPAYMSPEQASGISTLDTRTDVYSLGVILYQLLTGRLPRDPSGSRLEMLRRIAETEPLPPRTGPHPVDRLLEAILLRALARSPEDRYSSVADFAKDLDAYLKGEAVAASPTSRSGRLRRFIRKNRMGLVVASAFAAVLLAATVVSIWQAVRATKFGAAALLERDHARRAQGAEAAQRRAAEQARAQTERINRFLSGMTASVDLRGALYRVQRSSRANTQPLGSADVLSELADHMRGRGRVVEAEPLSLEALRQDQQAGNTTGINVLYHWTYHAQILDDKGDLDGAEQYTLKMLAEARREFPQPNRLLGYGIYTTAMLLKEHGKYARAEPLAHEVRALLDRFPEIDAAGGGDAVLTICQQQIYTGLGNLSEAQRWGRHYRALSRATLPELTRAIEVYRYDAERRALRGALYGRLGQFREAMEDGSSGFCVGSA